MSEIAKRLRKWAECGPNQLMEGASADLFVAADEITRLTARVRELEEALLKADRFIALGSPSLASDTLRRTIILSLPQEPKDD